jgi:hypothetical protein
VGYQYDYFLTDETSLKLGRASSALGNLEEKLSFFGLVERFDEFLVLLRLFLGCPDICYRRPINTARQLLDHESAEAHALLRLYTGDSQKIDKLRELLSDDVEFYTRAKALYFKRMQQLDKNLGKQVSIESAVLAYQELNNRHKEVADAVNNLFGPGRECNPIFDQR